MSQLRSCWHGRASAIKSAGTKLVGTKLVGTRSVGTLSVDLDNLWTYQRSFGVGSWQTFPSFLEKAIPRLVAFGREHDVRLTAFVVGKDLEIPGVDQLLSDLDRAGHEIGNHSYLHEPDLHSRSLQEIHRDLSKTEAAIYRVIDKRPSGFRGPAFCVSRNLQQALIERGYLYDASSFPTTIGPLARSYQHMLGTLSKREKDEQKRLYGGFDTAYDSLKPFSWRYGESSLIELPVSTMPLLRLPIHFTYINFLADISPVLAKVYFKLWLALCRARDLPPSLLLHATDFIGCDDNFELGMMPGMKRSAREKIALMAELLSSCATNTDLMPLNEFAEMLSSEEGLPQKPLLPASSLPYTGEISD